MVVMSRLLKFSFLFLLVFFSGIDELNAATDSVLTERIDLAEFGKIAYRAPLEGTSGTPIVLIQGVFAGSTHRHMREIRDLLDQRGRAVFTLDLPGTGESDAPKVIYNFPMLTRFVDAFLTEVLAGQAVVVAEQVMGLAALELAKTKPELFAKIVFIGPTGAIYLKDPPTTQQNTQFSRVWADDQMSLGIYQRFVSEDSARYYLGLAYFDPAQVTDERVREITATQAIPDQRWTTLSFVFGRIYRSFADAVQGLRVPLTVIIGEETRSLVNGGPPENVDAFRAIAPGLQYVVVSASGGLPHRERPEVIVGDIDAGVNRF
jgi:pimeloyl-ACP methyl ester carboxylesterase